jgi:hypothetical protein
MRDKQPVPVACISRLIFLILIPSDIYFHGH